MIPTSRFLGSLPNLGPGVRCGFAGTTVLFPTPARFPRRIQVFQFAIWAHTPKETDSARRFAQPPGDYDPEDHENDGKRH